ncbi:MAG TPA: DUF1622 domain-containing protein [Pyrinomonadaceae bacterium]|nr:DUF1622 domain-containing protein [Pyrinomonadaceae bacterium]
MIEETITTLVLGLKLFIETIGALFIGVGALLTLARFIRVLSKPSIRGYESTRLLLARFLSLGLEFQLAADILGTAVAPSWAQIGKLGAIAVIRTGLNYFLAREMKEEQEVVQEDEQEQVAIERKLA